MLLCSSGEMRQFRINHYQHLGQELLHLLHVLGIPAPAPSKNPIWRTLPKSSLEKEKDGVGRGMKVNALGKKKKKKTKTILYKDNYFFFSIMVFLPQEKFIMQLKRQINHVPHFLKRQ